MALISSSLFLDKISDPDAPDECTNSFKAGGAFGILCSFVLMANCYYLWKEARDSG